MQQLLTLPTPRGIAVRSDDKKSYVTPAGRLPGATTILAATSEGKERLNRWLQRPDSPQISAAARARGTWTHNAIEAWILAHAANPSPPDLPNPNHFAFGSYWRSAHQFLTTYWQHAVALERPVYHPSGYAGSFDALGYSSYGHSPDSLTLFDWKTSKHQRDETLLRDYYDQLGAYYHAINYVYRITPERGLLVIARPTTTPDIYELNHSDLEAARDRFLQRLQAFYTSRD